MSQLSSLNKSVKKSLLVTMLTVFKYFHDLSHFFCQINLIYVVQITSYFEFLLIKPISFIVLTKKKIKINELNILRHQVTYLFKLNQQYLFFAVKQIKGNLIPHDITPLKKQHLAIIICDGADILSSVNLS